MADLEAPTVDLFRNGKDFHTLKAGSTVTLLALKFTPWIAIVTHPSNLPYLVNADGSIKELPVG